MVHRKIIDPVLKNLGPSRADYFNRFVDRVERDPRAETVPNLVYLVLRETIPYLPADLPQEELADRLLDFVIGSQGWLNRVIHDRRFIRRPRPAGRGDQEICPSGAGIGHGPTPGQRNSGR
jgi:hypothetical protein